MQQACFKDVHTVIRKHSLKMKRYMYVYVRCRHCKPKTHANDKQA